MKMDKDFLRKRIDVAAGRALADLVIKNGNVVDVCSGIIKKMDVAVTDGIIVGLGNYDGKEEVDATDKYIVPGFIDSHIHIESSLVSPEEISRLVVPHGTTTIVADPHEIVNVCGVDGLNYMLEAAKESELDIKYMIPSCVPATTFENNGANINSMVVREFLQMENVLGLGEMMNYTGVVDCYEEVIDKLSTCIESEKIIDGHAPNVKGMDLNAYTSVNILTDHECSNVEEMREKIERGMYIALREGSACKDLRKLLKGITPYNSRRCMLCSDDRQPKTIFEFGHMENHLRICVEEGIDPIIAIQMATLNVAECYGMRDRGIMAPGRRGDIVIVNNLKEFKAEKVYIEGKLIAECGKYLKPVVRVDAFKVMSSFSVKDFSEEKLKMHLNSNRVNVIGIEPGTVVTKRLEREVELTLGGEFIYNPNVDIVKIAVVERHKATGNVATAFLSGYGINRGAIATSIAHDSHNIIVVGVNDKDMELAVNEIINQKGGVVLVNNGQVIESLPLPIAGLISNKSGEWVDDKLDKIYDKAINVLGVNKQIDPLITLCFMALPVIPEIKLTDMGLFNVNEFEFIPIESEGAINNNMIDRACEEIYAMPRMRV